MFTIILAGGSGTRLFPLSRSSYPKQFIPLLSDESLFQKAVRRALIFSKPEEIYIVTNEEHKYLVQNQLTELRLTSCNVLHEPCGRNTLPAVYYAVREINRINSDADVLVLSSDQLIDDSEEYRLAISAAKKLAESYLVTFGIVPTYPHTGYGYIKPGSTLTGGYEVLEFKEKPDAESAEKYIIDGYLWNAGIFCFKSAVFIDECRKYVPEILHAFEKSIAEAYSLLPKLSVDYGILEKSDKVAVVPMNISWNDLGSFSALYDVRKKDIHGNAVSGEYLSPDGNNNLIISDKLVATVGLSDIAVIDTSDVLLLSPKNQSQKIGDIVDLLKERGDERADMNTTVHRPWGVYTTLFRTDSYLVKRLIIHPHKRISLQYHNHRSEHWVVVKGVAEVTNGDVISKVCAGESTFIPVGCIHRLANESDETLEVVEVQNGTPLTEEDIVRCEDDFKRI